MQCLSPAGPVPAECDKGISCEVDHSARLELNALTTSIERFRPTIVEAGVAWYDVDLSSPIETQGRLL